MTTFIILQKYIPRLLVRTLKPIRTPNLKCGINGKTQTGILVMV